MWHNRCRVNTNDIYPFRFKAIKHPFGRAKAVGSISRIDAAEKVLLRGIFSATYTLVPPLEAIEVIYRTEASANYQVD